MAYGRSRVFHTFIVNSCFGMSTGSMTAMACLNTRISTFHRLDEDLIGIVALQNAGNGLASDH